MERFSLDGTWWLTEFIPGEGEAAGAFHPDFPLPPERTIPAKVPGVVHLDLMNAGKIPDPFYRRNELDARWVEEREWWYRRSFLVDKGFLSHDEVELVFHGLDTVATVWLNGEGLGETENMFVPHLFSVKGSLREGENILVVKFAPPTKVAEEREARFGKLWAAFYSARPYLRKAPYSFGWDWGPRLPTVGIWRPVELRAYDTACFRHLWGFVKALSDDRRQAEVQVEAEIHAVTETEATIHFELRHGDQNFEVSTPIPLMRGNQTVKATLTVSNPRLWFPNGLGDQPLYTLTATLKVEGAVISSHSVRVGLRTVELVRERDEEGESFLFRVNGIPVFCKGANWIPSDSFLPRVTGQRYRDLLTKAKGAHMNMLRVWGGGIYEDETFYDLCDELGIMVWQDFMFACAEYPEEAWFHEGVQREAETVVKMLRHHPCIVLWCGNNENDWLFHAGGFGRKDRFLGETIYARLLPRVCERLDPSRPYWQGSPFGGADPNSEREGDRHSWSVWSGWRDYSKYHEDRGRFISEFGFQAPPSLETVESFTAPQDRYPNSLVMEHHNKQGEGTERLYRFLAAHFRVPEDFADWIRLTQINQGEALKTGIVHWRRRKFKTAGTLFWQLNDCWPVVSWSVLDYFGRPKAAYYFVKRAFAPFLVAVLPEGEKVRVWLINDTLKEMTGTLVVRVQDFWGRVLKEKGEVVTVSPNASECPVTLTLPEGFDPFRHFVSAEFYPQVGEGAEPVSYDALFFVPFKHLPRPKGEVTRGVITVDGCRATVQIRATAFVKGVFLGVDGDPDAFWDDNAFDLLPGMTRTVTGHLSRPMGVNELRERLRIWFT